MMAPATIESLVEFHGTLVAVLVFGRGDHGLDAKLKQVFVDPVGAITLIAGECDGPSDALAVAILESLVRVFQQRVEHRRFMGLSGRQVKAERVALAIAKHVDFCRKTAARTASCLILRRFVVTFFEPPAAQRCARIAVPSTHQSS